MRLVRTAVVGGLLAAAVVAGGTDASAGGRTAVPNCNTIQQPVLLKAEATATGAQFLWSSVSWASEGYAYSEQRLINGQWVRIGSWGNLGGVTTLFLPWEKDGLRATAIYASIVGNCTGTAYGVGATVYFSDYKPPAAATPAPAPSVVKPTVPRVECVNKKTYEIKTFALPRCPKGWRLA